jgi:hypothetical protein
MNYLHVRKCGINVLHDVTTKNITRIFTQIITTNFTYAVTEYFVRKCAIIVLHVTTKKITRIFTQIITTKFTNTITEYLPAELHNWRPIEKGSAPWSHS